MRSPSAWPSAKPEPDRFERAALRWLARYCVDRAASTEEVADAADAFTQMPTEPAQALATLRRLVG